MTQKNRSHDRIHEGAVTRRSRRRQMICQKLEQRYMLAAEHGIQPSEDVLTFVLDFKEPTQPATVDVFNNITTGFDVTSFGFAAGEFDSIADAVLRGVKKDFFDELVGTVAGPVGQDLAIDFVIGDIGTPPVGASEYYYIQIGTLTAGPDLGAGTLGNAALGGVRDATGIGPNSTVVVGSVVGSVFTDVLNSLPGLTPPDALTGGRFSFSVNAVANTISTEIGRALSLSNIASVGSVQPTIGVAPLMGQISIDLLAREVTYDRQFSLAGTDPENANADRQHIQQLVDAVGLHTIPEGSISGVIFNDVNENGIQEAGEQGVEGVIVYADYDNDAQLDLNEPLATTNSLGEYTINGVRRDDVIIRKFSSDPLRGTGSEATSVILTEVSEQTPDFIEIQNVSGETVDTSGWFVVANSGFNGNLSINSATFSAFDFPDSLAPGEILTTTDDNTLPFYYGANLNYVTATPLFALLVDASGVVRDSVFVGFREEEIANLNVFVNGHTFTAADVDWRGDGIPVTRITTNSYQRVGLGDTNSGLDWVRQPISQDSVNTGLNPDFGLMSTGRIISDVGGNSVTQQDQGVFVPGSRDEAFFTAITSNGNRELFKTDGTAAGTILVRDLSGTVSSNPQQLTWSGDRLYFTAETLDGQRELYVSDGSFPGTSQVRDLRGTLSSDPQDLTMLNNTLLFTALRNDGQRELFRSEGTFQTTALVRDLSGSNDSSPQDLTAVGTQVFFTALTNSGQRELYVTDGTFAGTNLVRDLAGSVSADPDQLTEFNGKLYFTALQSNGQRELYVSDGTFSGTGLVANVNGSLSGAPQDLTPVGNGLYFTATLGASDRELYFTDGTAAGTFVVTDLVANGNPSDLTAVGNDLYFVARATGGQRELYLAKQSGQTWRLIRDLSDQVSATPQFLAAVGDQLVFTARKSDGQQELYVTDGTFTGTSLVRDLSGGNSSLPKNTTTVGSRVFFSAVQSSGQRELYLSDGTSPGTMLISDLSGIVSSEPNDFTPAPIGLSLPISLVVASPSSSAKISQASLDVNQDGVFTALDALFVINIIGNQSAEAEAVLETAPLRGDVTGDGVVSPLDALFLINRLSLPTVAIVPANESKASDTDSALLDAPAELWSQDGPIFQGDVTPVQSSYELPEFPPITELSHDQIVDQTIRELEDWIEI
ncbi:MAG: hypothetical protein KDB00_17645 [Planctomycetales bacterium]|nr:hypothetical protein [Planctomycetales bacterium]